METPSSPPVKVETASVEEIVGHLPGAQSLPDGFSVSENFPEVTTSGVSDISERSREDASENSAAPEKIGGSLDISTGVSQGTENASLADPLEPPLGPLSSEAKVLLSSSKMSETGAGHSSEQSNREKELLALTDFPVDSTADLPASVTKSSEKVRTFPVPLSEGEVASLVESDADSQKDGLRGPLLFGVDTSTKVMTGNEAAVGGNAESGTDSDGDDSDRPSSSQTSHLSMATTRRDPNTNDEPLQDMLELKIAELEVVSTGSLKVDDEASKRAKARKRQVKEVKAMLDGTERNPDEKLRLLNTKYLQQVAENKNLAKELSTLQRKLEQANKEKDTIYGEYSKASGLRQKLESLCRELQRQNKLLFDDSRRIANEEQMKRQELSTKFHNTIKDITSKLEEQGDERLQQIKENEMLRETLKALTQQVEKRDLHFNHQLKTKELEQQLAEVKLKQQEELVAQEESKSRLYKEQIAHQLKVEQDLRAQLALYGDKFEQFQETLTKSNEVFATFKKEMEKMSKTIKKLEKENIALKKKAEKSDVTVIELLDERVTLKKQLETSKNQKDRLEGLCRSMQAERKSSAAATLPSQASLQEAMSAVEPQSQ
ncbi:uncharacterized protein [Physcomitrium patens]|nr:alpha-taxilin-like isoform X2 [Physcomitrium patens]PNR45666.1 hypothetical protein PHYPA_015437 [Physcomitrium patens]|eukprot:XP_024388593.1 alpha-taxilin-like isoform X2 [Physcomitrella patens]